MSFLATTLPADTEIVAEGGAHHIVCAGKRTTVPYPTHDAALGMALKMESARAAMQQVARALGIDAETRPGIAAGAIGASAYTRQQYERACVELDLEPEDDEHLAGLDGGYVYSIHTAETVRLVEMILANRRVGGLRADVAARQERTMDQITEQVGSGPYTRDAYERACALAGLTPVADAGCVAIAEQQITRMGASGALDIATPMQPLVADLAIQRAAGVEQEALSAGRQCAECDHPIPAGAGMLATGGLACTPKCHAALSG